MLAQEKSKLVLNIDNLIKLLYGEAGIGKTTACSQMGNPYFIATERGHVGVEVYKSDVSCWEEFCDVAQELLTTNHDFKPVVIDTVSNAFDMCCQYLCRTRKVDHIGDLAHGKGYDLVGNEFKKPLLALATSRMGLVMTCHEVLKEASFRGRVISRYWPNLPKRARDIVIPMSNMVGRMFADVKNVGQKLEEKRYITFQIRTDCEAKDHSGRLSKIDRICVEPVENCWSNVKKVFLGENEDDQSGNVREVEIDG